MSDPMDVIRQTFFAECQELLGSLIDALGVIADSPDRHDAEALAAAFRAVHSIKGGAAAFGMSALVEFSHDFETALDTCRTTPGRLTAEAARTFLKCSDILGNLVAAEDSGEEVNTARVDAVHEELVAFIDGKSEPLPLAPCQASGEWRWRVDLVPDAAFYMRDDDLADVLRALAELGDIETRAHVDESVMDLRALPGALRVEVLLPDAVSVDDIADTLKSYGLNAEVTDLFDLGDEPQVQTAETGKRAPLARAHTVRVDLQRIDRLVNLVGELVINQSMLAQALQLSRRTASPVIEARLAEYQQLTRDIQSSVISIRAQPVKPLFNRMTAIVREAADELNKSVRVKVTGETTEFDTTAIERLAEPLTHLVRNAVDHGLGTPEKRTSVGKNPEGTVTLSARQSGDQIEISVADDGKGIDRDAVLHKARARGLIPANTELTESEIDHLLFLPGFTTREQVSEYSGRGVGMDVVSAQIAELGGRASIRSTPGAGTEVTLYLPLTLALLDGMVVRVENEPIVLPMTSIQETLTLTDSSVLRLVDGAFALRVHDAFYPLLDLGDVLGFRTTPSRFDGRSAVVITPEQSAPLAYCVDDVEDRRQVVIKRFDTGFGAAQGLTAATILGDGEVALILDPSRFGPSANAATVLQEAL